MTERRLKFGRDGGGSLGHEARPSRTDLKLARDLHSCRWRAPPRRPPKLSKSRVVSLKQTAIWKQPLLVRVAATLHSTSAKNLLRRGGQFPVLLRGSVLSRKVQQPNSRCRKIPPLPFRAHAPELLREPLTFRRHRRRAFAASGPRPRFRTADPSSQRKHLDAGRSQSGVRRRDKLSASAVSRHYSGQEIVRSQSAETFQSG